MSDALLDLLDEGLCSAGADLRVRAGWNKAFAGLFGDGDWTGKSVLDAAFAALPETRRDELAEAFKVALGSAAGSPDLLNAMLPLREWDHLKLSGAGAKRLRLEFRLVRFELPGGAPALLFRFSDLSAAAADRAKAEEARLEAEDQHERIRQLLSADRASVAYFLEDLKTGVEDLAASLRSLKEGEANTALLDDAVSAAHSIKGEALSLGFAQTAEHARFLEALLKSKRLAPVDMALRLELIGAYERLANEGRAFARVLDKLSVFLQGDAARSLDALLVRLYELMDEWAEGAYDAAALTAAVEAAAEAAGGDAYRDAGSLERVLSMACQHAAREERKLAKLSFSAEVGRLSPQIAANLKEALLHLVRNSVAHGIESPASRVAAGKAPTGRIEVRLRESPGELIVEYSDDGAGLDLAALRAKAAESGLLSPEAAAALDAASAAKLVFKEGLSTRSETGAAAGLGYGMSAVARAVLKRLRGKVSMTHRAGKGLSLRFSVPL